MPDGSDARIPFDEAAYVAEITSGGPCFICQIVDGTDPSPDEHNIVHRDGAHIAFFNRYPTVRGYCLVAPTSHREHAIGDFDEQEYAAMQHYVWRVGRAISSVVPTERLYVVSLGSQQGIRHVHWHLVPCPPETPFLDQQLALMDRTHVGGVLHIPVAERVALAAEIAAAMPD